MIAFLLQAVGDRWGFAALLRQLALVIVSSDEQ
jgi:hypothetical protein